MPFYSCRFAAHEILKALQPFESSSQLSSKLENLNRQFKVAEQLHGQGKLLKSAETFHKITSEGIKLLKQQKLTWLQRFKQESIPLNLLKSLHAQSKEQLEAFRLKEEQKALELEALKASFDASWYLENYRDVKRAGLDPWVHYITHGRQEGRAIRPSDAKPIEPVRKPVTRTLLFNETWYCAKYPKFMSARKKAS